MSNQQLSEMLSINVEQKNYYEVASGGQTHEANSGATNLWRRLRLRVLSAFHGSTLGSSITDLHRAWIGDLAGKKVLELGVGNGSPFSELFAAEAKEYVAIDLSSTRIEELRKRLPERDNVRLFVSDFLSPDFAETGFDFIYADAVVHHFKHLPTFLDVLEMKLAPGGRVVTFDPINVWWGARLVRAAFRPFQTDAEWEYPFSESSMRAIEDRFDVLDCQGVMGRSKWAALLGSISPSLGAKKARDWHLHDLESMRTPASLRHCLQGSYHLVKGTHRPDDGLRAPRVRFHRR